MEGKVLVAVCQPLWIDRRGRRGGSACLGGPRRGCPSLRRRRCDRSRRLQRSGSWHRHSHGAAGQTHARLSSGATGRRSPSYPTRSSASARRLRTTLRQPSPRPRSSSRPSCPWSRPCRWRSSPVSSIRARSRFRGALSSSTPSRALGYRPATGATGTRSTRGPTTSLRSCSAGRSSGHSRPTSRDSPRAWRPGNAAPRVCSDCCDSLAAGESRRWHRTADGRRSAARV